MIFEQGLCIESLCLEWTANPGKLSIEEFICPNGEIFSLTNFGPMKSTVKITNEAPPLLDIFIAPRMVYTLFDNGPQNCSCMTANATTLKGDGKWFEERTLEMVNAGLHCSFRMSRQILPLLLMFGWKTFVLNATCMIHSE